MSKFIRTKYGIYEVESEFLDNEGKWVGYNIVGNDIAIILRTQVINQADTIEELCDEFVLYDNQLKTYGVFDKKVITFKWIQNHSTIYKGMTIYGAIWTSKGLIYVAKMDKKGDLELI